MTTLIRHVCLTHPRRGDLRPIITFVEGGWAYCEGHGSPPHEWAEIEPTRAEFIAEAFPVRDRSGWLQRARQRAASLLRR